jgi:hypothetical protein
MAASANLVHPAQDPLLHEIELPLRGSYYPVGFRVNLTTNSHHVLEAAKEAWSDYTAEFARQPIEIRAVVRPEGALVEEQPVYRGQGDLYSIVYDRHNFAVYDVASMSGYCFVSEKTAADHLRVRMFFVEAMTYSLLAQRYVVPMHAAAVMRNGRGVLLCGQSGAGKSTLSYACARAGWTFVSDDATLLPVDGGLRVAIGRPGVARFREDAPRLFPELARYVAEQRPNGKMTIEAALPDFALRTSVRCPVDHLVMLDRGPGDACIDSIPAREVVDKLLGDMPAYGERVRIMYERTLSRLLDAAAWRMRYETLEQALKILSELK